MHLRNNFFNQLHPRLVRQIVIPRVREPVACEKVDRLPSSVPGHRIDLSRFASSLETLSRPAAGIDFVKISAPCLRKPRWNENAVKAKLPQSVPPLPLPYFHLGRLRGQRRAAPRRAIKVKGTYAN